MPFYNFRAWYINPLDFPKQGVLKEKMKFLVRFGILAPSSHNVQPWRFRIGENFIDLYADFSRRLKESDESGRMLYTALGCVTQNIKIAADYYGLNCHIQYDPRLENSLPEHVLRIQFEQDQGRETDRPHKGLFKAIQQRVSYRGTYIKKPIPQSFFTVVQTLQSDEYIKYDIITDENEKEEMARIIGEGMKHKMSQKEFRGELADWLRTNWTLKYDGMPGEGHGMSLLLSIIAPFVLRFIDVSDVEEKKAMRRVRGFPALCILHSRNDNAFLWVKTGEILEKFLLSIYASGMAASIMVAGIEAHEARIKMWEFLVRTHGNKEKFRPQMFFGFGFPEKSAPHSPRRPLSEVLYETSNH